LNAGVGLSTNGDVRDCVGWVRLSDYGSSFTGDTIEVRGYLDAPGVSPEIGVDGGEGSDLLVWSDYFTGLGGDRGMFQAVLTVCDRQSERVTIGVVGNHGDGERFSG
jgi:hypothetical protein